MSEWKRRRKEFEEKYFYNDHEALMTLLEIGDKLATRNRVCEKEIFRLLEKLGAQTFELEACAEQNYDKKNKIESIIELVNEYRLSEDHTLARAHIALYKIDMDILSKELETSIYNQEVR